MSDLSSVKFAQTPVLNIGYEDHGDISGFPIMLLHGFPYDVRSWDSVVPPLTNAGYRVLVPYLREYGPTSFRDGDSPGWPNRRRSLKTSLTLRERWG